MTTIEQNLLDTFWTRKEAELSIKTNRMILGAFALTLMFLAGMMFSNTLTLGKLTSSVETIINMTK